MTTPLDDNTGDTPDEDDLDDQTLINYIVDRATSDGDFADALLAALDDAGVLDEEEDNTGTAAGAGAGGNGAGNGSQPAPARAAETALRNLLAGKAS